MDRINYNAPGFRARTIIKAPEHLLNGDEVTKLTKMGQKIGLATDQISFSVFEQKDSLQVAHNASFNDGVNMLNCHQIKKSYSKDFNLSEYIKAKLIDLSDIYSAHFQ